MKYKLTFALVASLASTAFAAFQAPLPEFKNEKQLAEWRAEHTAKSGTQSIASQDTAFYTGRPYLASSGDYVFKYRSYDPVLARWTPEDPSGFPDGANQHFYAPTPTSQFDYCGLASDIAIVGSVVEIWKSAGFTYSVRLAELSLHTSEDRVAEPDEKTSLQNASQFSDLFNKSYFQGKYSSGITTGTGVVDYNGLSDLGHSYGKVAFGYDISLSGTSSYSVDFSFEDIYDFNPASNNPAIRAFNRLQQAGTASIYTSSGVFTKFYE